MAHLRTRTERGVFDLHVRPHLAAVGNLALGPDMGVRPHVDILPQHALVHLGGVDHAAVPHHGVDEHGVGADLASVSNHRMAPQDGPRQDHGPGPDGHTRVYIGTVGVQDIDPCVLMVGGNVLLHRLLQPDQLRHRAEREHHAAHRQHCLMDLLDPAALGKLAHIPPVGVLRSHRAGRVLREAGRRLVVVLRIADNIKPLDALFRPCPHTPFQYRAK